jgi:hypothetical protein
VFVPRARAIYLPADAGTKAMVTFVVGTVQSTALGAAIDCCLFVVAAGLALIAALLPLRAAVRGARATSIGAGAASHAFFTATGLHGVVATGQTGIAAGQTEVATILGRLSARPPCGGHQSTRGQDNGRDRHLSFVKHREPPIPESFVETKSSRCHIRSAATHSIKNTAARND